MKKYNQLNPYEHTVFSQFGEDGIIEEIFNRIGTTNRLCIDLGAYDGITKSNTANLIVNKGWTGLLIEANPISYNQAQNNYEKLDINSVNIMNHFITKENINDIFIENNVPINFDFLSIDIGSNDYWVWQALSQFKPRVIVLEYNANFPPPLEWVLPYDPKYTLSDASNYYGASLESFAKLGKKLGYSLIGTEKIGCNAFFIHDELIPKSNFNRLTTKQAYHTPKYGSHNGGYPPKAHKEIKLKTPFDTRAFTLKGDLNDKSVISMIRPEVGLWSPNITSLLSKIVKPDDVCIDLGANIGTISLILSHLAHEGKVYAFEPGDSNYYFLLQNIIGNNISNIRPVNVAIGNDSSSIDYVTFDTGGAWSYGKPHDKAFEIVPEYISENIYKEISVKSVDIIKIDHFMSDNKIDRLDVLKIDIQGSELQAIKGAINSIQKYKPHLVIEFCPVCVEKLYGDDPEELYDILSAIYSKIFVISHNLNPITSYNELLKIIANYPEPKHCDLYLCND